MTTTATTPARRRGPGRPRDEELDGRVLQATLDLIDADEPVTVGRIVTKGGVSRAALYRRWPSLTMLVAAALDTGREIPPAIPVDDHLRESVLNSLLGGQGTAGHASYSETRLRRRIQLAMADRALQKAYWQTHVARRRVSLENALRGAVERGMLRSDVDPAVVFDLLAGVVYYQIVVRGDSLDEPATRTRCLDAFDIVWCGMATE